MDDRTALILVDIQNDYFPAAFMAALSAAYAQVLSAEALIQKIA